MIQKRTGKRQSFGYTNQFSNVRFIIEAVVFEISCLFKTVSIT